MKTTQTFAAVIVIATLSACTKPDDTKRVLSDNGYTNIEITGYRMFKCDEKDTFCTGFSATSPIGKRVTGAVGSGIMKAYTIRLD